MLARLVATNVGDSAVWTQLARLLAIIASQSGDPFATYPQRAAPLGPPVDNQELLTVYLGTVCRDGFMPLPAEIEAIATDLAKAAPRFAAVSDIATGAGECATWPVHGVPPEIRVPIMGGHFVVVSALLDVATPTEIAKALAERHGASLVTYDDATHGVYGQDRCVNAAVDAYLINLTDPGAVNC